MKKLRKKVYMVEGYNTLAFGSGRKEFHPKKPRPGLEHYIKEAAQKTLKGIGGAKNVDECVIGNFMASRFNKQAHLGAFLPMVDKELALKPSFRVEGACASGGLALVAAIRSILAETADVVLAVGAEVQNSVKAIYGADILAGAGWFQERKEGHAYFFPGAFSDRAGAYYEKYGRDKARNGMAHWFKNAIENARTCPTAQEFHNKTTDLVKMGLSEPNPKFFVEHLNVFDCSKVSDGASAIAVVSEEGLQRIGLSANEAVEITGWAQVTADITVKPADPTKMDTTGAAVKEALNCSGITINDVGTVETHDCFSIAGIMAIEAMGLAKYGEGPDFVADGHTTRNGQIPFNTTGGLIGWGHPTGCTGVHQAVTIWEQLTNKAKDSQITLSSDRPFGLSVNMGGDDKTLVSLVYKPGK